MKPILPTAFLALCPILALAGPVRDHHLVAELVPVTDAIVPGKTLTVCLNIKHDPEWHTYWKNPGLAGVPTKIDWELPDGFSAGPIQWARPQRVKMAIYNTFGYEGEVTLLIDIEAPNDLQPGKEIELKAKTSWMMCAQTCYPSNAKLSLTLPVATEAKPDPRGKRLADATRATMPVENDQWDLSASLGEDAATLSLIRRPGVTTDPDPGELYFFSDDGLIDSHPEQIVTRESPGVYRMILPLAEFGPKHPQSLSGVLLVKSKPEAKAYSIETRLNPKSK